MISRILISATAVAALSTFAMAGTYTPPPAPAAIPPAIVPAGPDWGGFYLGAQVGYADIGANVPGISGDGAIGGIIGGYDLDFGRAVVGLGVDYDWTDISVAPGVTADDVLRVKLRSGWEFGNGLAYITSGYAEVGVNTLGDQDGYFFGAGYDHLLSESFSIGGEVLYHEFDNVAGTPVDLDATTVQIRGAYRF